MRKKSWRRRWLLGAGVILIPLTALIGTLLVRAVTLKPAPLAPGPRRR